MIGHGNYISSSHVDSMDAFKPLAGALYRAISADAGDVIRAKTNLVTDIGEHDDFTVNMWFKPGWEHADNSGNTVTEFWSFGLPGRTSNSEDHIRFYYHRANNRFFMVYNDTVSGTLRGKYNFWFVHSAQASASMHSLGVSSTKSNYWSASNNLHVNGDGWGMLTFVKHASSGTNWVSGTAVDMFWNGNVVGTYGVRHVNDAPYFLSGAASGTNASSASHFDFDTSVQKEMVIGSFPTGGNFGARDPNGYSEISVWNKSLSVAEVEELTTDHTVGDVSSRTATNPLVHSAKANLIHYWPCHSGGTDFAQTATHHTKTDSDIIITGNNYIGQI